MRREPIIDFVAMAQAIRKIQRERNLEGRDISHESGVSESSICRALKGERLGSDCYSKLCIWLGVPFEAFIKGGSGVPVVTTPDKIELALLKDPTLNEKHAYQIADLMRSAYQIAVNNF